MFSFWLQRSKGWGDIPPAPKQDTELKYLDLALDSNSENNTHRLTAPPPGQSTPTEYKEIDFVKTIGLQELKSKVQNDRKHDEAWQQIKQGEKIAVRTWFFTWRSVAVNRRGWGEVWPEGAVGCSVAVNQGRSEREI